MLRRALLYLVVWFWTAGAALAAPPRAADLRVTAIDVGQGDAILLEVGAGDAKKIVLIDGGPPAGAEALLGALGRAGVQAIDLLVVTHAHLDHIGGLARV